jgi:hypothetical protein
MAPEQLDLAGHRAMNDLYSFGVIIYVRPAAPTA